MTRSRLGGYKRAVQYKLVKRYKWPIQKAKNWTTDHHDYMIAMYESSCPTSQVAEYISKMESPNGEKRQEQDKTP